MNLAEIENRLSNSLNKIRVIDAHEHLVPEKRRVTRKVDFFLLFSTYTRMDFLSAGMPAELYARLRNDEHMPLDDKWKAFSQFYPMIRHGSFSRPARIWLQDALGYDDLTEKNYQEVSEKLQDGNKPGLYRRVLCEMCNIETALVVPNPAFDIRIPPYHPPYGYDEHDMVLLRPFWRAINYTELEYMRKFIESRQRQENIGIAEYLDWVEVEFKRYQKIGVFGIKAVCGPFEKPDLAGADKLFRALQKKNGPGAALTQAESWTLASVIYDRVFKLAQAQRLTVAVHSGVFGGGRDSQPAYLIPAAMNYPEVSFDLFHLGMPYVREAVMIGKMFPNVSLNLCWSTVVAPEQTWRALDECLDMVSLNKVIAFGGDYNLPVEKVYGHLKMAKEVVARVLSKRVWKGRMDFEEALRIAQMWFYDNPRRIYNLR